MFEELKTRVDKFPNLFYYEPMTEGEIIDFEKKVGRRINSVYHEFLLTFGLVQDILRSISTSEESILEDVKYLRDVIPDYFPIFVDVDEVDTIYIMSTLNLNNEMVYKVIDNNEKLGEIQPFMTLTELVSISIEEIEKGESERCLNSEKKNCYEYSFEGKFYDDFIDIFEVAGLELLSDWQPKYYPDNVFGDEIAEFTFSGINFYMERDEDKTKYKFEFDESILIKEEKSIANKIDKLLNVQRIKHSKDVVKLIWT
ncbi:MAG: hypothetical protein JEY96_19460 [Bacteroidales bacterium]|nr:hypothetical protein [Bacteroidales bacterium]